MALSNLELEYFVDVLSETIITLTHDEIGEYKLAEKVSEIHSALERELRYNDKEG